MIQIIPLTGIGEIGEGQALAPVLVSALACAGLTLLEGDVLVVTQKIVSKSEGRFVSLAAVTVGAEAERVGGIVRKDPRLVQLVLAESQAIVRAAPHVLITRHRLGYVMANAGIDRSNVGPNGDDRVLLLPADPDISAARLRQQIGELVGLTPGVVIADSFGRPWRYGVVSVAIGAAGVPSLIDRRGEVDRDNRALEVTQIAFADLLASAAVLAGGEGAEGIPAVLVRGLRPQEPDAPAAALVRPLSEDLFQ